MKEYKGIYYGNNIIFRNFYEGGAHFRYIDLYHALLNISINDRTLEFHSKSKKNKLKKLKTDLLIGCNKRKINIQNKYHLNNNSPISVFQKSKKCDKINIENDNTHNDKFEFENFSMNFTHRRFLSHKYNNDSYDNNKIHISNSTSNYNNDIYYSNYQRQTSYCSNPNKSKIKSNDKNKKKNTSSKSQKNKKQVNHINKKSNLYINSSIIFKKCSSLKKQKQKLNSTMKITENKNYITFKKKGISLNKNSVISYKIKKNNKKNKTILNKGNISKIFINLSHETKKRKNNTITNISYHNKLSKNKSVGNIPKIPINLKEKNNSIIMLSHRIKGNTLEEFGIYNKKNKINKYDKIGFRKTPKCTINLENITSQKKENIRTIIQPQIFYHINRILKKRSNNLCDYKPKKIEFDNYVNTHNFEKFKKYDLESILHNNKSTVIKKKKKKIYLGGEDIPKGRFKGKFTNYYNTVKNDDLLKILFID